MSRYRFAKEIGVTASYVTRLCKKQPPWPSRELVKRIGEVTGGWVTPNDLAGYGQPDQSPYQGLPWSPVEPADGQAVDI